MNLLTQNSDLRKTGIFGWTLPAHWVTLSDGRKFNTCPNAGICAAFCYAKNGTYNFKNVKKAHLEKLELVLNNREAWKKIMNQELCKKKYSGKYIRIHDAGDFFSVDYALDWIEIAKNNPQCVFYAYTKEVSMFKNLIKQIPDNFITIYSYGGKEDHLINKEIDRHSDVFSSYEEMISAGYNDIADDDKQAAVNDNHKVGLYRNNIPSFVKKMGNKNFSNFKELSKLDKIANTNP
jgi:hypothetical protein